jgi:hypothetical protein
MANWPEATKAYFTRMPRMTLRIRQHTLKLRALCWVLRRLKARAGGLRGWSERVARRQTQGD